MNSGDAERREALLDRPYWSPAAAAFMLRHSKRQVNRWIEKGLPVYEIGGFRWVKADEAREWARRNSRRARRGQQRAG